MNKRISLFLCISLLFIVSCSRVPVRITREEAIPLQNAIDGILNGDALLYRSAFPADYDSALAEETLKLDGVELNQYLSNNLFSYAKDIMLENYGENYGIEFVVYNAITTVDIEKKPEHFSLYSDYHVYSYQLDLSKIEKAVEVSGDLNIWGNECEESATATYIMLKIDGKWYLHPMYYYIMFA